MDDDRTLLRRWRRDVGVVSDAATDRVEDSGRRLLAAWDEPHRAYHARAHLAETLAALDILTGQDPDTTTDPGPGAAPTALGRAGHPTRPPLGRADAAVGALALWFHDAVYDPRAAAGENESRSADLAERVLTTLEVGEPVRRRVHDLIAMTAEHDAATDPVAAAVHDADLWILAAPPARFESYCEQVRREYAHVPPADYATGRSRILTALADRAGGLYRTPTGRSRWEAPAQANVRRELARLTPTPPPRLP